MDKAFEAIKTIALNAVEAEKPCDIRLGEAVSVNEVRIGQKLVLNRDHLIFVRGTGFEQGDTVVLLREPGGQSYIVLGVTENN